MDSKAIEETDEISRMLDFIPELQKVFDVKGKVGEGTFSKVYRARVKTDVKKECKEYALKYLVPTSRPSRIASELQCLKDVGGSCNIVGVELCLMHRGHVVIVMPYFPHERFVDYMRYLTVVEIRDYMKNLLLALDKIHAHGIIHRDVKPNNFLLDRRTNRYALVDFGLAQRLRDVNKTNPRHSTTPQPFKDHNATVKQERMNKSDPTRIDSTEIPDRLPKKAFQSAPLLPRKRLSNFDQENGGKPLKKLSLDLSQNDSLLPTSSKTSILPTPPHTPSSLYGNSRIGTKPFMNTPVTDNSRQTPKNAALPKDCQCFGKNLVCKVCLGRPVEEAPRGGTPGFRAPEVLLKHRDQSTALDMWSAGVILLSLLSRRYPFFRAEDDLSSLAEIALIVGVNEVKEAALSLGKSLMINVPAFTEMMKARETLTPVRYLQALCVMYRNEDSEYTYEKDKHLNAHGGRTSSQNCDIPESAYDLLYRLLDPNPRTRITASEAIAHPFMSTS